MKKISYILTLSLLAALPFNAFAEEQTITLKDGSVIKGELSGMANGVYTIQTPSLGVTQIKAEQIASINNSSAVDPGNISLNDPSNKNQMNQIQQNIMANPTLMADIQELASDPEMIKLLSNPQMLQAVMSKDMDAIKNNPATQELMNNPKMQALIQKLQENSSSSSN